jgi:hypothetical protein
MFYKCQTYFKPAPQKILTKPLGELSKRVHFKFTRFYCLTLILSEGEANGW